MRFDSQALRKHGTTQTSLRSEQKTFRTRRRIGVVVIHHTMLRQPLFCNKVLGVFARTLRAEDGRVISFVVTLVYEMTIDCAPRLVTHHAHRQRRR